MLAIGLMSGTSMDGCDACLVQVDEQNLSFKILDFITNPYLDTFKEKIRRNLDVNSARLDEICSLNFELGYVFKDTIDILLKKNNLEYKDIEYVASHGQTIWHQPVAAKDLVPSTLQIGSPIVISTLTGIKTISNFREADIVTGGNGAPLVPGFEVIYFKNYGKDVILQNIGGISNLTYLKQNGSNDEVMAFDTGVGNAMIDYFMKKYFNKPFDNEGKIAQSGDIIIELLEYLKKDEYVKKTPPKSTGREMYSSEYFEKLAKDFDFESYNKNDIITTVTEFTVYNICYNYKKFIKKEFDENTIVIVSGGGAHNLYIINRLNEELNNTVITLGDEFTDAKEALAFAVLGYLSLKGLCGNVKKATGAKSDCILGQITLAKKL